MLVLELFINGLLLGGLYTCIGVAFSLIWGVMNIVNLAHGSMIILGAYVAYVLSTSWRLNPLLAIPICAGVLFVVGYVMQLYVINRVVQRSIFMTLILTFGIDLLLINAMIVLFSADPRTLAPPFGGLGIGYRAIIIPYVRVAVFAIALLLTGALYVFLEFSRMGNAIKAASFDQVAAQLVGVDIPRIFAVTFGLGAALAGAAGPLLGVVYPFSPVLGGGLTMKAFAVVVLGGLGSIPGAVLAGLTLGVAENLSTLFLGPGYQDVISFAVLLTVLVVRPTGLLGKQFYAELKL